MFPLLDLPVLAQEAIINQIDVADVIHLSLVNQKFKETLTKFKLKAMEFHVTLHNPPCGFISIRTKFPISNNLFFCLKESKVVLERSENKFLFPSDLSYTSQERQIEQITRDLHSFIRFKKYSFSAVNVGIDSVINCFMWKYSKKYRNFLFHQNPVDRIVSKDHLDFLFKEITVEEMKLELKTDSLRLGYEPSLNQRALTLNFGNSIKFSSFLTMDCVTAAIKLPRITSEDIIRFLESWITGKLENLQNFQVEIMNDVFDEQLVFERFKDQKQALDQKPNELIIQRGDGGEALATFGLRTFEFSRRC